MKDLEFVAFDARYSNLSTKERRAFIDLLFSIRETKGYIDGYADCSMNGDVAGRAIIKEKIEELGKLVAKLEL